MKKPYLACLVICLMWAGMSSAQTPEEVPILPMPGQAVEAPLASGTLLDGIQSCFGQPAQPGMAVSSAFTSDLEYVLWYIPKNKSDEIAALGSTGVLGQPGTEILGGRRANVAALFSGARLTLGYWQIQENPWIRGGIRDLGVETVFSFLPERSVHVVDSSSPTIVRPFFDINNRRESAFLVAAPGLVTGGLAGQAQASLWGAEANLWKNVFFDYPGTSLSVNLLAGLRYLDLNERLNINSTSVFNDALPVFSPLLPFAGDTLQVSDSFGTRNRFVGGQVGISAKWWPLEWICMETALKLGIGMTSEDLDISGQQIRTLPDRAKIFSPGGLLALPTNSGSFHGNQFSQTPELDVKLSGPLTNNLTIYTGFSALYWSKILRPAQQIDRDLDITQIPNFPPAASATPTGLNAPGVPFRQSALWVLGFSFGLEVTW